MTTTVRKPLTSRELKEYIAANKPARTVVEPRPVRSVADVNLALADQDSALGTDPGARPDAGGEVIAEDYTTPEASREGQGVKTADELSGHGVTIPTASPEPVAEPLTPLDDEDVVEYPTGAPSAKWGRDELDAYALKVKGLDTTGEPNKAAALAAIQNAPASTP